MKRSLILTAALLTVAAYQVAPASDDQKALEGEWKIVAAEQQGKKIADLVDTAFTFKGDKLRIKLALADALPTNHTIKIDAGKKPRTLDMHRMGTDEIVKAIYELQGGTLRICIPDQSEGERPKSFESKEGILLTLNRAESVAEKKPNAEDLKAELKVLQGTWRLTQLQLHGKALPWMDVEGLKGTAMVRDDKIEVRPPSTFRVATFRRVGDDTIPAWRPVLQHIIREREKTPLPEVQQPLPPVVTLNPSAKTKRIDVDLDDSKALGIYVVEGDRMTVCISDPRKPRPAEIKGGPGFSVLTLVRGNEPKQDEAGVKVVQDEQEKLNGVWEVVQGSFDTQKLSEKDRKGFQLTFRDGEVIWKEAEASETLKVRLGQPIRPVPTLVHSGLYRSAASS